MPRRIYVLDTTLRDGEQVPGAKLNLYEKLEIAKQLKRLKVDMIEVGFPASSKGDFDSVKTIAEEVGKDVVITALGRAVKSDIDAVYNSIKNAEKPMIHMVLGTSDVHVQKKFKQSRDSILEMGVEAVKYAKTLLPEIQYSPEDATRSDFEYLWKTVEAVVKAGATCINIADTVGYAVPERFGELIKNINYRLKNLDDKVILSVHCHNDTGLAVANTLAAIRNGADKVECTINGLGERAGNASLEEVVMGLKVHPEYYGGYSNVQTRELLRTSKLVSAMMGLDVQVNKAITGENAFAHSSGIHQDGLLKSRDVYEVIRPEDVGAQEMELVLTARSGRHAFKHVLGNLGYENMEEGIFDTIYESFLELADRKKEVYDHDVYYLLKEYYRGKNQDCTGNGIELYGLLDFQVISNTLFPTATVKLKKGEEILVQSANGNGPIDALCSAITCIVGKDIQLKEYRINSISRGKDALGRVCIQFEYNRKIYNAKAVDTDVIKASVLAFLNGVNKIALENKTS